MVDPQDPQDPLSSWHRGVVKVASCNAKDVTGELTWGKRGVIDPVQWDDKWDDHFTITIRMHFTELYTTKVGRYVRGVAVSTCSIYCTTERTLLNCSL